MTFRPYFQFHFPIFGNGLFFGNCVCCGATTRFAYKFKLEGYYFDYYCFDCYEFIFERQDASALR